MSNPQEEARLCKVLLRSTFVAFVFLSAFFHVSDVDVGYHMRTGAHILEGNGIPAVNTFSHTVPNERWVAQQWWPATAYYLMYLWGGIGALTGFKACLVVVIMWLAWSSAGQETRPASLWPFWTVTIGVLIARVRFFERPDLFSALLFALTWQLDTRFDTNPRWQWLGLPLLMAFWANTHAGVIYGFVLLAVFSASEWIRWCWRAYQPDRSQQPAESREYRSTLKQLMIRPMGFLLSAGAAIIALELVNPNGFRVLLVPISQFLSPFWQSIILEYFPPSWAESKLFYIFLFALIVLQLATWKQLNLRLALASLVFGYLACSSQRSILIFTLVAIPHAAYILDHLFPLDRLWVARRQRLALPAVWVFLVVGIFMRDQTFLFGIGLYPPYYPMTIFRFIEKEVPPQNLFNEMRYGGSILWWLYPRFKPFIDGRGDAYSEAFWRKEYLPVLRSEPGWRETLHTYDTHAVLLPIDSPQHVPKLAQTLFDDPQWALVAYNDDTLLFLERTETNQNVIATHQFRLIWPGDWTFAKLDSADTKRAATAEAQRALNLAPESVFAQTAFARACLVNDRFEQAAQLFGWLTQRKGASEKYWRDYGYALFRLGQLDKAEGVFSHMTKHKLAPGFAFYMRHVIALHRRDPNAAAKFLSQALEIEPDNSQFRAARTNLDAPVPK
jgi:hypothetical protein